MIDERADTPAALLSLASISKRFGRLQANDAIDFAVHSGEVHALLGENGAGKSTLMNIASGMLIPDSGTISIRGEVRRFASPADAIDAGIGMVHQHFELVRTLTVAENITLHAEVGSPVRIDQKRTRDEIAALALRVGLAVDPEARVADLSVAMQQRVEILKALYRDADVLLLDEPTAVLAPPEVAELLEILRGLAAAGKGIVIITHKLEEATSLADRLTVMRAGAVVAEFSRGQATQSQLAQAMVGRDVITVTAEPATPGDPVLRVRDLHATDSRGVGVVSGISFELRAGEILGVAGIDGNGQTELVEVLAGMRKPSDGEIVVGDAPLAIGDSRRILEQGVAHVPADRHRHGLVLDATLTENFSLRSYYRAPYSRAAFLDRREARRRTVHGMERFAVRAAGPEARASELSGGNQQKLILARELADDPTVLLASQPTRGLDVGSIETVHRRLLEQRDAGCGILLVSFELEEIFALSSRIVVLYEGHIVYESDRAHASREDVGRAMAGVIER